MTTIAPTSATTPLPPPPEVIAGRVLLRGVTWATYERLLADIGDAAGIRITYDNGLMEIEMPSLSHERIKVLIGRMIVAFSEEFNIDLVGAGSTTWRREAEGRGLEADDCYFVQHANLPEVLGATDAEQLAVPPDLAVEVDLTSGSIDKEAIYAALGVGEVWQYQDGRLHYRRLRGDRGGYDDAAQSNCFPTLPARLIEDALRLAGGLTDTAFTRQFRQQLRSQIPPG